MSINNLQELTREQLAEVANKQGLVVHHNAKPETIIKQILDHLATAQANQVTEHVKGVEAQKPKKPAERHTVEEVENAISHIKRGQPAFESGYNGDVFHFRCRGVEESGNINQPIETLVRIAANVARGRRALMSPNQPFDQIGAQGDNSYTNTVIAG